MAKKTKKYETTNNNQLRNIVKKQNGPLTNSDAAFQSRDSKFLVREKTRTRTYDTRTNFLYQDSRTSFLYKKLGPSAISLTDEQRPACLVSR